MIGKTVGNYEVVAKLGAGGMGEVYRARDAKLGRDVAIKILPAQFLTDADRLARLQREARTLAALNHPNIAQIYGLESHAPLDNARGAVSESRTALVMELVEGEDLSAIIARGPIPLADALAIARQIARALEAAHESGIVHRDLKPANIKVRADGAVKVLDFGLAKAIGPDGVNSSSNLSNSPTMTSPATELGVILGTAAYMSPEQARGKAVDRRSDVWAFGVILLEMLSGRRVFDGAEVSDVLASILKDTPSFDRLPAETPSAIRRLLRRCLQKDRAERLDSMAAAQLDIAEAMAPDYETDLQSARKALAASRWAPIGIPVAAAIGLAAGVAFALWTRPQSSAVAPSSFALTPIGGATVGVNVNQPDLAISPDGRRLVYASALTESSAMFVRSLDGFADSRLAGLGAQPRSAFFSPDGKWMAYYTASASGFDGRLMKLPVDGTGVPSEIAKVNGNLRGASWGADGTIVFATAALDNGLFRVPASGGVPEQLTAPDNAAGEVDHVWPCALPDGKHVIFAIARQTPEVGGGRWDLAALDVSTRKWQVIRADASYPIYLPNGYLIFASPAGLSAVRFDPVSVSLRGEAQALLGDVLFKQTTGAADVAVSSTGTLAYVAGQSDESRTLVWTDREGRVTPIPAPPRDYIVGVLSPDGDRVAVTLNEKGSSGIHVYDFGRTTLMRLTPEGFPAYGPVWSESGREIYFSGSPARGSGVFVMAASGTGTPTSVVSATEGRYQAYSIRRGAAEILIDQWRGTGLRSTFVLKPGTPPSLTPLNLSMHDSQPSLSPDGRWLAYRSDEGGIPQVYLRPYPDLAADRIVISTQGGRDPRWSKTGELFFWAPDGAVWVTKVGADRTQVGKPMRLPSPQSGTPIVGSFDVTADGQRFLRMVPQQAESTAELRVVTNWFEVLRARFGAR